MAIASLFWLPTHFSLSFTLTYIHTGSRTCIWVEMHVDSFKSHLSLKILFIFLWSHFHNVAVWVLLPPFSVNKPQVKMVDVLSPIAETMWLSLLAKFRLCEFLLPHKRWNNIGNLKLHSIWKSHQPSCLLYNLFCSLILPLPPHHTHTHILRPVLRLIRVAGYWELILGWCPVFY